MINRIIYYYQTFNGIQSILTQNTKVTHIHLASIHFGTDENNNPYVHLNNNNPNDKIFDSVWEDIKKAKQLGIKIILMIGGAGGAFQDLFSNFDTYYSLLKELLLEKKDLIDGVDLDIEEQVSLENVEHLILQIKKDFGNSFIITLAPVQSSIENDVQGMGGFVYKDLYNKCGNLIEYFNVQCYYDYSLNSYKQMIKNGYPEEKIVMGSISSQNFNSNLEVLKEIVNKYINFGGVFNWEYYDAPDNWSNIVYNTLV